MRQSQIAGIALAAVFTVTTSALAQTAPTQTFSGCLMAERDYRSAHKLGAGQAGGVGLGDEFVLVDVKVSPAKATAATPASGTPTVVASTEAVVSTKCADAGTAYRLTGSDEEQLKTLLGRQIEIQGRFKNAAEVEAAGARPEGTLPVEVEMISFREAPAAMAVTAQTATPASPSIAPPPAVDPARSQTTTPVTEPRRELPGTAGSTALYALVGLVALSSGLALTVIRRRVL